MNTQVAINSIAINKNSSKFDFQKYNLEVSIEEIENRITSNKLKYGLTLLSNPKNVRLSVEGIAKISGTEAECIKALEKDEKGIPRVLHLIYQDLFPTIFMTTKVVGAPCPAYRLAQISEESDIQGSAETQEQPEAESVKAEPKTEEQSDETIATEPKAPEQATTIATEPKAPEQATTIATEPKAPEQATTIATEPKAPEQATTIATEPKAPEQATTIATEPKAPEQATTIATEPKAPEQSAPKAEKNPEDMSLDELNQLYSKLGAEYQDNPTGEIGEKLQNISELIQKRQQEQMVTETSSM